MTILIRVVMITILTSHPDLDFGHVCSANTGTFSYCLSSDWFSGTLSMLSRPECMPTLPSPSEYHLRAYERLTCVVNCKPAQPPALRATMACSTASGRLSRTKGTLLLASPKSSFTDHWLIRDKGSVASTAVSMPRF